MDHRGLQQYIVQIIEQNIPTNTDDNEFQTHWEPQKISSMSRVKTR